MTEPTAAENALYQDVVMDHKRAPRNFGTLPAPTHQARGHNPQCGDDLQVALDVAEGKVQDVRFTGHGCAICMASASMMTEAIRGREVALAEQLQQRFRAVLTGQLEPEAAQLGKLISLAGVRRYPSRIKCALLGWHAMHHALAGSDSGVTSTETDAELASAGTEPASASTGTGPAPASAGADASGGAR